MISRFFIDRPIFATVLSIIISLTGTIALMYLPVAQYPRITPPGIAITISYPGANAQEVADSIAAPIEQQVNGVEGMLYMSSNSGNDGSYTLTVTFDIGTDVNSALVMVQNRVTLAMPLLPSAAQNQGITIRKRTPDMLMIVNFISDGRYDDKYLSNYATIYAKDEMLRVYGISDLTIFGQRDWSMRVWLDPLKLASRSMTAIDISNIITDTNVDAPVGRVGVPPIANGLSFQYPIDCLARLVEIEDYRGMDVKAGGSTPTLGMSGKPIGATAAAAPPPLTVTGGPSNLTSMAINPIGGGVGGGSGGGGGGIPNTSAGGTYITNANALSADSAVSGTLSIPDPPAVPVLTDIDQSTSFSAPLTVPTGGAGFPSTSTSSALTAMSNMTQGTVGPLGLTGGSMSGPQSPSSALVKMSDISRLELGAQNYNTVCSFDGTPSVGFGLYQLPGTNALEVATRVRAKMEELKKDFPDGVDYRIAYDTSLFVSDSVYDVVWTLVDAIGLVAVVVLVFLQSWRAAIIPLIAIPVSILGTFVAMAALNFSLNNISLFGMVLAIGIVVDDAIVVVENVERWLEHGLAPREATYKAMEEVTGPIIAVALVLSAVFVPCAFIRGITGQFFRQFAITIAVSTVISTVNSLTFSPAMAAILLRPKGSRRDPLAWVMFLLFGWFFWLFNKAFGAVTRAYGWSVGKAVSGRAAVLIVYSVFLLMTVMSVQDLPGWAARQIEWLKEKGFHATTFRDAPKGFIPPQDQGRLIVNVQLPDAISLDMTYDTVLQVERIALDVPGVGHTITTAGMSYLLQANSPNFAAMFIVLKPFDVRNQGWYQFTGKAFEEMKADGVPDEVLAKLNVETMTREQMIAALSASARVPRNWPGMSDNRLRRLLRDKEFAWDDFTKVIEAVLSDGEKSAYESTIVKRGQQDTLLNDVVIMQKLRERWAKGVDAQVTVFPSAPIPGLGSAGGFKFVVEDRGGLGVRALEQQMGNLVDKFKKLADYRLTDKSFARLTGEGGQSAGKKQQAKTMPPEVVAKLLPLRDEEYSRESLGRKIDKLLDPQEAEKYRETVIDAADKVPYLADAKTQFRARIPQLFVDVDRVKAMALGVSINDVNNTLIMNLGSLYVTSYNAFGRHWQVTIQVDGEFRNQRERLLQYQVRNSSGQMVPLSTLVTLREIGGPISINRYNLYTSAPIQGNVLQGVSDGEAIDAINKVAADTLPLTMRIEWTELMFLQIRAGNTAIYIFILSVISVFLALSALYESWALPLAVIMVVPLCQLCSVVGTVDVAGKDVNIFVQIGLVVLVGLACKNAILIVEFAKQLHQGGRSVREATIEASRLRLRPILMTSFAFIFGVMPLMFAAGAGAEMRRSLGTAVFSGMLGVTVFGIFLTPVFFYIIQGLSENPILNALPFKSFLSQGLGGFLGFATGYMFGSVNTGISPVWGSLIGAAAGALIVRGFRGAHVRPTTRSGFGRFFGKGEGTRDKVPDPGGVEAISRGLSDRGEAADRSTPGGPSGAN